MTSLSQLFRTALLTIAWLIVLPCLCLLVSAIVPVVPYIRIVAFDVVPNSAPWFVITALGVLAVGIVAHMRRATQVTGGLIAIGGLAAILAGGITAQLIRVAQNNGARITLARTLSLRSFNEEAAPDATRVYARPDGEPLSLDIYRPEKGAPGVRSPVMVIVHGGGFVEGSRRLGAANMRSYARRGWTVISIDYRLARAGRPTWDLATGDVRCALAWVARYADRLNVDIDRLTLFGASAGGSLAIAAAYTADPVRHQGCGSPVPHVATVVVKSPLIDPLGSWQRAGEMQDLQQSYMARYLGGSPARYPDRYAAMDLRRYIRAGNAPTLIMTGANDPLLPAVAVEDFTRRAAQAGTYVRLVQFPYSGHAFNTTYHGIPNQAVMQIVAGFLIEQRVAPTGAPVARGARTAERIAVRD